MNQYSNFVVVVVDLIDSWEVDLMIYPGQIHLLCVKDSAK